VNSVNGKDAIPFLDLATPHIELEQQLTEIFKRALHTASFIGGPMVEQFEQAFAELSDSQLKELFAQSQPSFTSPEAGYER